MHTLIALVAVVTACVLARPPASSSPTGPPPQTHLPIDDSPKKTPLAIPGPIAIDDYIIPYFLRSPLLNYDENMDLDPGLEDIYREFGYIDNTMDDNSETPLELGNLMQPREPMKLYVDNLRDLTDELTRSNQRPLEFQQTPLKLSDPPVYQDALESTTPTIQAPKTSSSNFKKGFALTPLDVGYYEMAPKHSSESEGKVIENANAAIEPRKTRQNPNLSRTKTLVAANLDKLRIGLSEVPGTSTGTDRPEHVHVYDTGVVSPDPAESIYGVALVAAVGAALVMAVVGFAFGWYTLSKRAKAAADVDYPAYGVTGPTAELAGDRKLAHSAHMYHYQHQKQQIIAMERNCVDQRNGSVSDPESEEENEEGDYTVYECPGFATTGDMEVKNPLFTDKTPATPGKCELVKPQPKD